MSKTSIQVSAEAFKPVDIQLTITTKRDLVDLGKVIRHGVISLPEESTFITDLSKQLQRI